MEPSSGVAVHRSDERLLRVREVAASLSVSTMTVYRLIHDGQLRAIRIGHGWRIPEGDLNSYLARGAEG